MSQQPRSRGRSFAGADLSPPSSSGSLRDLIRVGTMLTGFGRVWTYRGLDDDAKWRLLADGERLRLPDPATGIPVHPGEPAMIEALRSDVLRIVASVPVKPARAMMRRLERGKDTVLAADPTAELRMAVCRRWDRARRQGDRGATTNNLYISRWFAKEFAEDALIRRFGTPTATTLRTWVNTRGFRNDRRWCDMEAVPGQGDRSPRVRGFSFELAHWHASRAAVNPLQTCAGGMRAFLRDYNRAVSGRPLKMDRFEHAERDLSALKRMDRTTFRKLYDMLGTAANARHKTSYDAVKSRRGGGGRSIETSRCWELVQMDEKEVSAHLFVDERRRIPLGCGSTTIAVEQKSTAIVGMDVTWEAPSTASAMRTLLHATSLKEVPPEFVEHYSDLQFVCSKIGGLLVDNGSQFIGDAVQDAGGDVVMDVILAGVRKGTDKALVESRHAIIGRMVDDMLPSHKLPIATLREWNLDPAGKTATDLAMYRAYFWLAVSIYNCTRRPDLGNRSPLDILMEDRRLHGNALPADVEQFKRAMSAQVAYRVIGGSGVIVNGLRYVHRSNHGALLDSFVLASADRRRTKNLRFDAKIKWDPSDLSVVWVLNPRLGEYVELHCTKERYASGLSLNLHRIIGLGFPDGDADAVAEEKLLEVRGCVEDRIERDHPEALAKTETAHERALADPRTFAVLADRFVSEFVPPSTTGADAVAHAMNMKRPDAANRPVRAKRGSAENDLDANRDDRPDATSASEAKARGKAAAPSDDRDQAPDGRNDGTSTSGLQGASGTPPDSESEGGKPDRGNSSFDVY
ncbi:hypothetical protein [Sphingomonas sp. PvP018]|uniref:hypothetical protein n=1 Tax=Sphingomonas sp. PvP018 TaxID=2817852 RepID=UPI001AEB9240|nr:hypothetical protein [Sphingomonas sp. PvP018]MBP2513760.1 hypothetical protein [Sphingomonas sp. PvP018]